MTRLSGSGPVVIVDDDDVDIELLATLYDLSDLKGRVELRTFRDGPSFLAYMSQVEIGRHEIPSMILLDINMPVMSGFEVLERMRSDSRFADVPAVLFLSNTDSPRDFERCQSLGAGFQEKFDNGTDYIDFFNSLVAVDPELRGG